MKKSDDQILDEFIQEIRQLFPEVSKSLDEWMLIQGWNHDDKMYCAIIEQFSQITTDCFNNNNIEKAKEYLDFMGVKFERASEIERAHIDACFVEHLMWDDCSGSRRRKCWDLMSENLQKLYLDFWNRKLYHKKNI